MVNSQCETVRRNLVEGPGDLDRFDPVVDVHLEDCEGCRHFAAAEDRLVRYLQAASPPADPALQQRVIFAVQAVEARKRRIAFLPVAASAVFMLAGVTVLGGVPGNALAATLPAMAGSGWFALAGSMTDFFGALHAVAVGLADVISGPVVIGATLAVMAGIGSLVSISKRWRRRTAWSEIT